MEDIIFPKVEMTIPELESRLIGTPMGPQLLSKVQSLMVAVEREKQMSATINVNLLECSAYLGQVRIAIYKQIKL